MSTSFIIYILLAAYIAFILMKGVHIAGEAERFAVITLGRFDGYRGPGLIMITPFITRAFRLRIGDTGTLISPELATFSGVEMPVTGVSSVKMGSTIEVTGFDDDGPRLSASLINHGGREA